MIPGAAASIEGSLKPDSLGLAGAVQSHWKKLAGTLGVLLLCLLFVRSVRTQHRSEEYNALMQKKISQRHADAPSESSALPTPQQQTTRVLVLKKERMMELFSGDTVIKTYMVALGRGGLAPKQRQGDHLTPEGLYQIDRRNKGSRFYRALHVSYPNGVDRERARKLGVDPGGDIMIHGITNGLGWLGSTQTLIDWTNGCIAVTDSEMDEVWLLVPDGIPIEIRP
jgi:murein L,D-transpeptidase YafK